MPGQRTEPNPPVAAITRPGGVLTRCRCAVRRLRRDEGAQAMTEYVILAGVMVVIAAYLYYPDNIIYQGFRLRYDRTVEVIAHPSP